MRVAILGAGLAGLATGLLLLKRSPQTEVVFFDPNGVGGGASGMATGILHAYGGAHAKLNRYGKEGLQATEALLTEIEEHLGVLCYQRTGLYRPAVSMQQKEDFEKAATLYEDVEWMPVNNLKSHPFLNPFAGIFISSALTIDVPTYLQSLFRLCQQKNAQLEKREADEEELLHFDHVVMAMGAALCRKKEAEHLALTPVKGQILTLDWNNQAPLPYPISSQGYLKMGKDNASCQVGTTYEKKFASEFPDQESAIREIVPKVASFFPAVCRLPLLKVQAGLRVSTPDHLPLISRVQNRWFFTGLGSKGLLYHALYAERLTRMLLQEHMRLGGKIKEEDHSRCESCSEGNHDKKPVQH